MNTYDLCCIGIGFSGMEIVKSLSARKESENIIFSLLETQSVVNLDIPSTRSSEEAIISFFQTTNDLPKTLLIVGDLSLIHHWIDIIEHAGEYGFKDIYSFCIPTISMSEQQIEFKFRMVLAGSTRSLLIPIKTIELYTKKELTTGEIVELGIDFTRTAISSFIYIYRKLNTSSNDEEQTAFSLMHSHGRIYYSIGDGGSEAFTETFWGILIPDSVREDTAQLILHVYISPRIDIEKDNPIDPKLLASVSHNANLLVYYDREERQQADVIMRLWALD